MNITLASVPGRLSETTIHNFRLTSSVSISSYRKDRWLHAKSLDW